VKLAVQTTGDEVMVGRGDKRGAVPAVSTEGSEEARRRRGKRVS